MTTRILVVEDHLIVQQGLVSLLGTRLDLQIVGVAANIREAKALLDRTMPDILLLDLSLEGGSGLDLARALYRSRSSTRVLVMTECFDGFAAAEAMGAGVAGYFLKDQPTDDLFAAIDVIRRGGKYVAPRIAADLRADQLAPKKSAPLERLSRTESEMFRMLAEGTTSKGLSRRFLMSAESVETHRTNISRKLGVHTVADLVRFAVAHGIPVARRRAEKDARVPKESRAPGRR